jgi:hypothetical protein
MMVTAAATAQWQRRWRRLRDGRGGDCAMAVAVATA